MAKCPYHGQASNTFLTKQEWVRRFRRPPNRPADLTWKGTNPPCEHWVNQEPQHDE